MLNISSRRVAIAFLKRGFLCHPSNGGEIQKDCESSTIFDTSRLLFSRINVGKTGTHRVRKRARASPTGAPDTFQVAVSPECPALNFRSSGHC